MKFCRKIDAARSRRYDIYKLLSCEMLENSYFLTKETYLRKYAKHELVNELRDVYPNLQRKTLGKMKIISKK